MLMILDGTLCPPLGTITMSFYAYHMPAGIRSRFGEAKNISCLLSELCHLPCQALILFLREWFKQKRKQIHVALYLWLFSVVNEWMSSLSFTQFTLFCWSLSSLHSKEDDNIAKTSNGEETKFNIKIRITKIKNYCRSWLFPPLYLFMIFLVQSHQV